MDRGGVSSVRSEKAGHGIVVDFGEDGAVIGLEILEHLTKARLATVLESAGLAKSGNKAELQEELKDGKS